jgi:hypothetical protein
VNRRRPASQSAQSPSAASGPAIAKSRMKRLALMAMAAVTMISAIENRATFA